MYHDPLLDRLVRAKQKHRFDAKLIEELRFEVQRLRRINRQNKFHFIPPIQAITK